MALYLVQHGKSLSADIDPEKSLSAEGITEVKRIAEAAGNYGISPSSIEHSGKKRAEQTAQIFASALKPENGVHQREGLSPLDDVIPVARKLDTDENLMLVGHLPFMEKLAAFLITGIAEKPVFRFQNGGILCLDKHPDTRTWVIKWALMPSIE
jgi:phosphohistidine phosphatase